jgi:hypothetical protein
MRTIGMLLVVLIAAAAHADDSGVLFDDGFETYTLPSEDADPTNPGDGNEANWRISEQRPDNIAVVYGSSTGGKGDNRQILHVDISEGEPVGFVRTFAAQPVGEPVRLIQSFKIRCNNVESPTDYRFNLSGDGGIATYVRFLPSSRDKRTSSDGFAVIAGSDDPEKPDKLIRKTVMPVIEQGQWYRVTVTVHMAEKTWDVLVENLDNDAEDQRGELSGLPFWQHPVVMHDFTMAAVSSSRPASDFDIDDVLIHVEPDDSASAK